MTEKPPGTPPASQTDGNDPGRLGLDDRGNVTWEWKDEGDLLADDSLGSTERLLALVDPALQVRDDDDDPLSPIGSGSKSLKSGYNPYNSGAHGEQNFRKKKNLKELSRWIELRKKLAAGKQADE